MLGVVIVVISPLLNYKDRLVQIRGYFACLVTGTRNHFYELSLFVDVEISS